MTTKYVHHLCIQTDQYEKSVNFYQQALGFSLVQEIPNFHNRDYNSWLRLGSFYIELQTGKKEEYLADVNLLSKGMVHFCLWVEDLEKEVQHLKELGVHFLLKADKEIYQVENGYLCKIVAPEGTIIELRDNQGI
ncbi:VOC family protein [Neobacillus sp. D3-1R]|uniref:VOC family protein n=1 Tax=Neobacillus sp. D3-1R TaxID=3445778 RepID=UPI003FA0C567